MSILFKIALYFVVLFSALTSRFLTTGAAGGDCDWNVTPREKAD
jgi:hypothetical protein